MSSNLDTHSICVMSISGFGALVSLFLFEILKTNTGRRSGSDLKAGHSEDGHRTAGSLWFLSCQLVNIFLYQGKRGRKGGGEGEEGGTPTYAGLS